uniref:Uncharacterized protein n=1 Tax=Nitrosopumivirus cobalaminus TaxID=3158414 RepID=A0AAU7N447_9VIRU
MEQLKDVIKSLTVKQKVIVLAQSVNETETPEEEEKIFEVAADIGYTEEEIDVSIRLAILIRDFPFLDINQVLERYNNG